MAQNRAANDEMDFEEDFGDTVILKSETDIKEENIKDDDILLFTQNDMDVFQSDAGAVDFEIVDNIGATVAIAENSGFNIPFNDEQLNQLINGGCFNQNDVFSAKLKSEGGLLHNVKYKVQDGKHTKVWQCGICLKEFGHQYILMRHLPTHTDERKFQCNTCGKAFRQMSTLSQHRAIHSVERPYVCEVCPKTFNRVSTLISHRKTHTGLKPHRCHLCNKAFHQKGNLRNHIFTHTNERPYKCDICMKGFNQMSNLMCHKLKAHQRADKPRYTCQSCGKEYQKRMELRNHEQYEHGDMSSNELPRMRYSNGVLVDPINTAAMQHALATNQIPFALLRPLSGIPVLVRVLAAGDKQMLVPATAEDLKKHGQITITPKGPEENKTESEDGSPPKDVPLDNDGKPTGSTVQIKIPVVATVVQRCGKDGNMCMDVESPGPSSQGVVQDNYFLTTCSEEDVPEDLATQEQSVTADVQLNNGNITDDQSITDTQYFDLSENAIDENNSDGDRSFQQSFTFDPDPHFQNDPIENRENIEPNNGGMYPEEIFEVQSGNSRTHVFQILEKPAAPIDDLAEGVLHGNDVLIGSANLDRQFL